MGQDHPESLTRWRPRTPRANGWASRARAGTDSLGSRKWPNRSSGHGWRGDFPRASSPTSTSLQSAHSPNSRPPSKKFTPARVIVDSFIAAFRAERPNAGKPDEWRGRCREVFSRDSETSVQPPWSQTHVRKSDGAGRDSGDLHAAVDLLIELRDENSNRHYSAPELGDRRRTLHYAGRILHGRVTHCLMGEDFGFTVVAGDWSPGGGGGSDPFTVASRSTRSTVRSPNTSCAP